MNFSCYVGKLKNGTATFQMPFFQKESPAGLTHFSSETKVQAPPLIEAAEEVHEELDFELHRSAVNESELHSDRMERRYNNRPKRYEGKRKVRRSVAIKKCRESKRAIV